MTETLPPGGSDHLAGDVAQPSLADKGLSFFFSLLVPSFPQGLQLINEKAESGGVSEFFYQMKTQDVHRETFHGRVSAAAQRLPFWLA